MEELSTNEYLRGIVLNLPSTPGIYQYLNKEGVIIYVGKAKNLKRRVYSYFSKEHQSAKTRILVSKIADIRYIVVNTEEDALLLENKVIHLSASATSIFHGYSRQGKLSGTVLHTMVRTVIFLLCKLC